MLLKVIQTGTIRKLGCGFLFTFHKGSGFIERLYCSTSHSRCSGTDHSFTCKLHRTCLYLVSVHQMAPPQTEVAGI